MPITRKPPARLTPGEGERQSTRAPKPIAASYHRQAGCSLSDEDVQWSVRFLSAAKDVSWKPADHLHEVVNHFLGFPSRLDSRRVRFWKTKNPDGWQLMVEHGGHLVQMGDLTIVVSQVKFQRALLKATGHFQPLLLKTYKPAIWHVLACCILKASQEKREEASNARP